MAGYIDVVFDGPPEAESGRFVEVEDETGASIVAGEWIERENGYWALRIATSQSEPEPSAECPQCHRPDGLHKLGCGERFGSEPQGEPSSAQEAIRVASPDTWDWDACVVCGSKDVTDRGMMVLFSAKEGVYVSRVAWCDQSQECRDDLRQAGASMLTDQDAKSIDAALRAAGEVRS